MRVKYWPSSTRVVAAGQAGERSDAYPTVAPSRYSEFPLPEGYLEGWFHTDNLQSTGEKNMDTIKNSGL